MAVWYIGPLTFETTFSNRNIDTDRPGSPGGTVFENTGSTRALSGVEKANLTYAGTAVVDPVALTFELDHDYNGVICL